MYMDFIRCSELSFSYNDANDKALNNINLNIQKGEFVALLGHNGSGKSTLGKLLNGLLPTNKNTIFVQDLDCSEHKNIISIRKLLGVVFQNPDNQLVSSVVEDEVAFGCENIGIPSDIMRQRVDYALKKVGMYEHKNDLVANLSGGQKQRIAIAGILAMQSEGIIFDEATAMLDPKGRQAVMDIAKELNNEGKTIIFITHYMDEAVQADRVYVLNNGQLTLQGTPQNVFANYDKLAENYLEIPQVAALANSLDINNCYTVDLLAKELLKKQFNKIDYKYNDYKNENDTILSVNNVSFGYNKNRNVIDDVSFEVKKGEVISIIGETGSGKSTLIQLLNGLYKPNSGSICFNGIPIDKIKNIKQKIGVVFQYPENQIFESTVFDEVAFAPKNLHLTEKEVYDRVKYALDFVNISEDYYKKSPLNLSGGEKRRIAIAGILAMQPDILVLDEPLAGLDPITRNMVLDNINKLSQSGTTIIMVSHLMEQAAEISDRILVMYNGKAVRFGTNEQVFGDRELCRQCGIEMPQITKVFEILNDNGVILPYAYKIKDAENILKKAVVK